MDPPDPEGSRLALHRPGRDELQLRQQWLQDPQMMSYNAGWHLPVAEYDDTTGCILWPEDQWDVFLEVYATNPASADYFYLRELATEAFVGHLHYRVEGDQAHVGVNIVPAQRRSGFGREGLGLLLDRIWDATMVDVVVNEFEDDRIAAGQLHRALGFEPTTITQYAGRSVRRWVATRDTVRL